MSAVDPIEPEVVFFSIAMQRKLDANRHKGGWKRCETLYLMRRLRNETEELAALVNSARRTGEWRLTTEERRAILDEAADVANFAMMIADVLGGLKLVHTPPPEPAEPRGGKAT